MLPHNSIPFGNWLVRACARLGPEWDCRVPEGTQAGQDNDLRRQVLGGWVVKRPMRNAKEGPVDAKRIRVRVQERVRAGCKAGRDR